MTLSNIAKNLFLGTLHHLMIADVMRTRIRHQNETLHIGELCYDLQNFRRIVVISIGKAATPMWEALRLNLEPAMKRGQTLEAIVVGSTSPQEVNSRVRFFFGSHPFPNQISIDAAETVLSVLASCNYRALVLFLISGGSSAMIEKSLDNGTTLEEAAQFYRSLVQSGLPITKMNALRKHFSQVKGGRLAVAAQEATQCTLLVSDVPENVLHIVGSGPSLPDPSTTQECRRIIAANRDRLNLPPKLLSFFENPELEETPKAGHPAFRKSDWMCLLSSDDLCRIAGETAVNLGFHVVVDNGCDDWDYKDAAVYLLDRLRELRQKHPKVCLLSAGEISVQIPPVHGIGGRNQQFVIECSRLIVEKNMRATVLSGGSDGIDGNSPAAGAVCDETTLGRAAAEGLDILAGLEGFDSFSVCNALGDTIITGPTGNNVRDLRILLSNAVG
jgi:hydroxypyruvate reductase